MFAKKTGIIRIPVLLMLLCINIFLSGCGPRENAEDLAAYAKEQFLANDYEKYIQYLREKSGLSDLDIEIYIDYDYEYDYNAKYKELSALGNLSFTSDEIDDYYTTEFNTKSSEKLLEVLYRLKNAYYKNQRYKYTNSKGAVFLDISNGTRDEIHVKTSSGRDYEFAYYVNFDEVKIDGEWVYMEEARDDE